MLGQYLLPDEFSDSKKHMFIGCTLETRNTGNNMIEANGYIQRDEGADSYSSLE
jgi:hypothetical protein